MGRILALVNQKGGCGKTTTAIHVAAALAHRDLKTLLIDLDPQGHAAMGLGVELPSDRPTLSDVLSRTCLTGVGPSIGEAIVAARPGIDIVPANLGLAALESRLANVPGREERLAEHLAEITDNWDAIIIDSPPNLGLLTINALVAANEVTVPVEPSAFSAQGAERVLETIRVVAETTGHQLVVRVLPTMVSTNDLFASTLFGEFRERHPGLVLPLRIRRSALFPRAAARGCTIAEVYPRASAWRDYRETADELRRGWAQAAAPAAERFAGLKVVAGGIAFSHPHLGPEQVQLAGDFNDWTPDRSVQLRNGGGTWTKFMPVRPGRYEYKFILNGEWVPDPENPRHAVSRMGTDNSLIEVPPDLPGRPVPVRGVDAEAL
ncbi:MAG: AAA family ATPase [Acidobacteria bacterium]|nr:AAA family ATPase [Acidobacteriota bacterium]